METVSGDIWETAAAKVGEGGEIGFGGGFEVEI